jgi:hypothetical protein
VKKSLYRIAQKTLPAKRGGEFFVIFRRRAPGALSSLKEKARQQAQENDQKTGLDALSLYQ